MSEFFTEGDFVNGLISMGEKPTKAAMAFDKLLPLLTREDLKKLCDEIAWVELRNPDTEPEVRRELLSRWDACPCCGRWLGHNNLPADNDDPPYRRQPSFDF